MPFFTLEEIIKIASKISVDRFIKMKCITSIDVDQYDVIKLQTGEEENYEAEPNGQDEQDEAEEQIESGEENQNNPDRF